MERLILCNFVVFCLGIPAAFGAIGRTAGTFDVTSTGQASYSIPIWVPPGTNGMQPTIALNYSSATGASIAGMGWNISGLSLITRCNGTIAQDGAAGAATLSATDKFCLDGNKLRLVSGTYGAAGSTYRTEIETFSRVTATGTAGSGPAWFEVYAKNGLIYEYGNSTDSRIEPLATGGGQATTVRAWR